MSAWTCALELDSRRQVRGGGAENLAAAIARGADLRVYTEWRLEEHMTPYDPNLSGKDREGLIREVIDFRQAILIAKTHVAGITTLRQPMLPTVGFNGTEGRMAFFLYNMTGHQACANLSLDGDASHAGSFGEKTMLAPPAAAKKMSVEECYDLQTCAPCRNFIYDMEIYRFIVRDDWREVLSHDREGQVLGGSIEELEDAFATGKELKVGIHGCLNELGDGPDHEVFSLIGSGFFHTARRTFECGVHPMVRVRPGIPLRYRSGEWDVAWIMLCSSGDASVRALNPQTRRFSDHTARFGCRWFVR